MRNIKHYGNIILILTLLFVVQSSYLVRATEATPNFEQKKILLLSPIDKCIFDKDLVDSLKQLAEVSLPNAIMEEQTISDLNSEIQINGLKSIVNNYGRFDLIICLDKNMLSTLKDYGKNILGDTPILFGFPNDMPLNVPNNIGGFYMPYKLDDFLNKILRLHPGTKKINFLISKEFKSTYFYDKIDDYIKKNRLNNLDISFNLVYIGQNDEVIKNLSDDNSLNIIYSPVKTYTARDYPIDSGNYGTMRSIARYTTNPSYGGFRTYATRFNIGGYNYDASALSKAIIDNSLKILNHSLDISNLGVQEFYPDNTLIINKQMQSVYHIPNNLSETIYDNFNSGATTFEKNQLKIKIFLIMLGILTIIILILRYIYANKHLKDRMKVDSMKNNFIANVSHELRTPLNIIISTIQLFDVYIDNNKLIINDPSIYSKFDYLKNYSNRLLRLVNNIIDITKLDAGFFTIEKTNNNIVSLIEEITLSTVPYAENREIKITFDTDIEELYIFCDRDRLERVFLNLLSNALKFTPKGGNILVTLIHTSDTLTVTVLDDGIGISQDKQDLIFERFKQAEDQVYRKSEGSGIGLSLCKSMIELHDGTISVESELNKGSKFIVTLPITDVTSDNINNNLANSLNNTIQLEYSDFNNFI